MIGLLLGVSLACAISLTSVSLLSRHTRILQGSNLLSVRAFKHNKVTVEALSLKVSREDIVAALRGSGVLLRFFTKLGWVAREPDGKG